MSRLSRLGSTIALLVAATALTAGPAFARDRDHDRMPDRWEKRHHLNVRQDDARRDRDRDRLTNYGEYRSHTNPRKKDSDRDGRRDAREDYDRDRLGNRAEIRNGFDPGDSDSDDDGVKDGRENAGTIAALSDSSVTIRLAVGGSLTARLGDDLSLECAPGTSGSGSAPDPDVPEPGEDAPEPGEDEDAPDTADGADDAPADGEGAPLARASQDDDGLDAAAFDKAFADEMGADSCDTTTLKVGARVHKARVASTGSGPELVSLVLVGTR
jgi:hypothetical protein